MPEICLRTDIPAKKTKKEIMLELWFVVENGIFINQETLLEEDVVQNALPFIQ